MRALAQRIERATREYFLTHEEGISELAPQTWEDQEKLWNRIQELKTEKELGYHAARQQAVEEFITQILDENCVRTSYKNLEPKHKYKTPEIPIAPVETKAEEDGADDDWNCDAPEKKEAAPLAAWVYREKKEPVRTATKRKPAPALDLDEEPLD